MTIEVSENWEESDLPYGWAGEWTCPNIIGFDKHFQLYADIATWILNNIHNPYGNCKWAKIGDCIYVQFRKKKDMTWFILRWQ